MVDVLPMHGYIVSIWISCQNARQAYQISHLSFATLGWFPAADIVPILLRYLSPLSFRHIFRLSSLILHLSLFREERWLL